MLGRKTGRKRGRERGQVREKKRRKKNKRKYIFYSDFVDDITEVKITSSQTYR